LLFIITVYPVIYYNITVRGCYNVIKLSK